jgi:hypothetical protein
LGVQQLPFGAWLSGARYPHLENYRNVYLHGMSALCARHWQRVHEAKTPVTTPTSPKLHRNYTVEEAASLYGVYKGTVRALDQGRTPCQPSMKNDLLLILGSDLAAFHKTSQIKKQTEVQDGRNLLRQMPRAQSASR